MFIQAYRGSALITMKNQCIYNEAECSYNTMLISIDMIFSTHYYEVQTTLQYLII
jgi:hypothetical protein